MSVFVVKQLTLQSEKMCLFKANFIFSMGCIWVCLAYLLSARFHSRGCFRLLEAHHGIPQYYK